MAQWYEGNHRLFREERAALASACPLLRLAVVGPGFKLNSESILKQECVVVHGTYGISVSDLIQQTEYGISLLLPEKYPKRPPIMFCNDPKLPIGNIDRHIMKDGSACLGVQADISMRWSIEPTIVNFLENFVAPFLVWQVYYDAHHKPPPWGERSHFSDGIVEFYAELLSRSAGDSVLEFMKLLARKNRPKGHELCPCGSGKRLRNCHRDLLYETRERVAWQHVAQDLEIILRDDRTKSY